MFSRTDFATMQRGEQMRLIDADALTIDLFKKAMDDALLTGNADMHSLLIQVVAHYPTVDAVPVIRCKDCKHYYAINEVRGHCSEHNFAEKIAVDFCSWAERRDNDSN